MTRKEETRKASIAYQMGVKPQAFGGDAFADKTMIEKACNWLKDNASNYIIEYLFSKVDFKEDKMIEDFKQAMEK